MLNYQRVGILPYSGSPHFLSTVNVGISWNIHIKQDVHVGLSQNGVPHSIL